MTANVHWECAFATPKAQRAWPRFYLVIAAMLGKPHAAAFRSAARQHHCRGLPDLELAYTGLSEVELRRRTGQHRKHPDADLGAPAARVRPGLAAKVRARSPGGGRDSQRERDSHRG